MADAVPLVTRIKSLVTLAGLHGPEGHAMWTQDHDAILLDFLKDPNPRRYVLSFADYYLNKNNNNNQIKKNLPQILTASSPTFITLSSSYNPLCQHTASRSCSTLSRRRPQMAVLTSRILKNVCSMEL